MIYNGRKRRKAQMFSASAQAEPEQESGKSRQKKRSLKGSARIWWSSERAAGEP